MTALSAKLKTHGTIGLKPRAIQEPFRMKFNERTMDKTENEH